MSSSWIQFEMFHGWDDDEQKIWEQREADRLHALRRQNLVQAWSYWRKERYNRFMEVEDRCGHRRGYDGKPCEAFKLFGMNGCFYHATGEEEKNN
jgi:hypothetical protein